MKIIRNVILTIVVIGTMVAGLAVGFSEPAQAVTRECPIGYARMAHNRNPGPYTPTTTYQQNCKLPLGTCIAVGRINLATIDYGPAGVFTLYDYTILDQAGAPYHNCRSEVVNGPWK